MTKSAVRAMDAVSEFAASPAGGGQPVTRYVVSGASKRGWTTWTTAAVDRRVIAIVPAVIDMLNVEPSFEHHWRTYGAWSEAVKDYVEQGIMDWMGTRQFHALMRIEEPYEYRDRLTMPKLMVNATGDQFFLPDSSQFYFDDLRGEKHLRYVPNTSHSLEKSDALETVQAFYAAIVSNTPRPEIRSTFERDGSIKVVAKDRPTSVLLWQAVNPGARNFRLDVIGPAYKSTPLTPSGPNTWVGRVPPPAEGWTAFFVEMTFPSGGKYPLKVTSGVRVLPDKLPYRGAEGEAGELTPNSDLQPAKELRTMNDRRRFLKLLAAAVGTTARVVAAPPQQSPASSVSRGTAIKKSTLISMLPRDRPYAERFAIARDAGFEAIEMKTVTAKEEAAEIREAAQKTGLRIHSVMNEDHWRMPISSGDAEVVNKSVQGMETSLHNAQLWGADAVLLVPAVVDARTSYRDAWTRSQKVIRERLLPMARDLKVVIAVEEVWNKFLLSPIEFARYVDEFESPWLKAYFDVGNVVFYGFPQDWIRTLGARIVKLHLKDFKLDRPASRYTFVNLGEGDIDWPEVRRALEEINFTGYATTELQSGDVTYLKNVSSRVDRILAGEKPVT